MIRMLPKLLNFNPRSREGSDALLDTRKQNLTYFNPRSREGSDLPVHSSGRSLCYFNPRSREGSDVILVVLLVTLDAFQSTLPRRERLDAAELERLHRDISIHAPAKGATGR